MKAKFFLFLVLAVAGCAYPYVDYYPARPAVVAPGYGVGRLDHFHKVVNGLADEVLVRGRTDETVALLPGGEVAIPFPRGGRSYRAVISAVVVRDGQAIGTASRQISVPRWEPAPSEAVWHITSYQRLR